MNANRTSDRGRRRGGPPDRLLRAALWHASRELPVFPLHPNTKVPAVEDWEHQATTETATITTWWREAPYNLGIATGPAGLLVVDLDRPKSPDDIPPADLSDVADGRAMLEQLAAAHGPIPRTWTVTTASGGTHLYFRQPDDGQRLGNTAGRLGWKIDTRGHGGYVVAAGSAVNGERYRHHVVRRAAELPEWIAAALAPPRTVAPNPIAGLHDATRYGLAALAGELDRLLATSEGSRNDALNRAAFALGQLIPSRALDADQVHDELLSAAHQIGLGTWEAERTIASGVAAGIKSPRRPGSGRASLG
jgi:hypothetical protein